LLAEGGDAAPAATQPHLRHLRQSLTQARPALLTFAVALDGVQQEIARGRVLGATGLRLLAWAWQRRAILGPTTDDLLAALPADWRPAAQIVLHAWESAVRASSPVETGHRFLRPHLAVQRALAPGLLALLAVYDNHHLATRGCHKETLRPSAAVRRGGHARGRRAPDRHVGVGREQHDRDGARVTPDVDHVRVLDEGLPGAVGPRDAPARALDPGDR
jgi:hypothetical protein